MAQKILVVDDQPFMVRLIQHHLERAGYELIMVRNPQEAKFAIEHGIPNLVLMTEKAGEKSTSLRNEGDSIVNTIPVIRMTDVPETMPQQIESSAESILRKPFSPTKLVAEVKRLLPKSHSDQTQNLLP
jgi:DNA-binding response OmpR family regulator